MNITNFKRFNDKFKIFENTDVKEFNILAKSIMENKDLTEQYLLTKLNNID